MKVHLPKIFASILLLLLSCMPVSCAQRTGMSIPGTYNADYTVSIERGRNIVAPLTRRGSSVSVAVGIDGQLVWSEAFGYTSLEEQELTRPDHPFYLYSLIKQITALMALQSVMNGEITFASTVGEVLPELPESYQQITLQQLITHRSGIRHYLNPAEANMFRNCESVTDALSYFVGDPLVYDPGTTTSYSTYGFVLASAMLERVSGLTFPELIKTRVADTVGTTTLKIDGFNKDDSPTFYEVDSHGDTSQALPLNNSCKMGGGGFLSSAEDLVKIHNAVLRGNLVPEPAVRQLLAPRSALEAGGSGPGGEAVSVLDLDKRLSVVVLSNTSGLEQNIALNRARELLVSVFSEPLLE